jgi:hypothetical protein
VSPSPNRVGVVACVVASAALASPASAAPQLSTSLALGAAGNGDRSHLWASTDFATGARGELLLGRSKDADFGVGPYVEAFSTTGLSTWQLGGGATVLVPVHAYLPVTLSLGGYAGRIEGEWQPGLAGELFWGSHGYNYDSLYALTAGIFGGVRYGLGSAHDVSLVVGARFDLEFVALPFVFAWNAIRGGDPAR